MTILVNRQELIESRSTEVFDGIVRISEGKDDLRLEGKCRDAEASRGMERNLEFGDHKGREEMIIQQ